MYSGQTIIDTIYIICNVIIGITNYIRYPFNWHTISYFQVSKVYTHPTKIYTNCFIITSPDKVHHYIRMYLKLVNKKNNLKYCNNNCQFLLL